MWRGREFLCCFVLNLLLSPCNSEWKRKECDVHDLLSVCDKTERCVMNPNSNGTSWCECLHGYEVRDGKCIPIPTTEKALPTTPRPEPKPSSGGGSVAAGLLIPTFLIILGAFVYFGARRYKWLQRFRQYRQNRYGNVLVTRDDTDDDDPPIS
ncbi:uncharacterized protein LOC117173490 [Belonocnema kinseyi]|uniref:uncharacterized protein LOC117173490 n=1 Tax=Belonocnema kinseyi TaxID=2817044 RepID=UPI00143DEC34|nr:uncharacterized protein LOC117173490 [Belonocnema kinseyi]